MPGPTVEQGAEEGRGQRPSPSIHTGIVVNNCDLLGQGKVLVRIPALDQEVWARLSAIGAGPNTGFFHAPNPDDEVLVALDQSSPAQAYVVGGLWSTLDTPPVSAPGTNLFKRKFRTGLPKVPLGHEIEFDDAEQSITVTTSTKQKIVMDPEKIQVSTTGGTLSITLNLAEQSISIQGVLKIDLSAEGEINLSAAKVSIEGTVQTEIKGGMVSVNGDALTEIKGTLVTIN
jgi:uncharacterized protein involved in type VI secretion and phage assembly